MVTNILLFPRKSALYLYQSVKRPLVPKYCILFCVNFTPQQQGSYGNANCSLFNPQTNQNLRRAIRQLHLDYLLALATIHKVLMKQHWKKKLLVSDLLKKQQSDKAFLIQANMQVCDMWS